MLNDDLITHLFNRFGLSLETGLKLWSNQIIILVLDDLLHARRDDGWKGLAHDNDSFYESSTLKQGFILPGVEESH